MTQGRPRCPKCGSVDVQPLSRTELMCKECMVVQPRLQVGEYADASIKSLRSQLSEARAEVERLRAAQAWRPIETAPKDGTEIILFAIEEGFEDEGPSVWIGSWSTTAWYGPAWTAYEHRSETEYLTPTHWLPLPSPPSAKEAGA